ncbi:MAG: hypothetical protein SGI98_03700 [Verrucomicrobiota bacterium]|nr:hypothetical protein [Verrucomicrobiota bacterium]
MPDLNADAFVWNDHKDDDAVKHVKENKSLRIKCVDDQKNIPKG